jgi:hypothetical protein
MVIVVFGDTNFPDRFSFFTFITGFCGILLQSYNIFLNYATLFLIFIILRNWRKSRNQILIMMPPREDAANEIVGFLTAGVAVANNGGVAGDEVVVGFFK